jgi:phosphopantothenoylcysteine decarboxylase/phosphopantothenate--cysteine ligase
MKILMGISGSIAAYRAPELVRALLAQGHEIEVLATPKALEFVTATTVETFLGKKLLSADPFDHQHTGTDHIRWSRWADRILVYGATAQTLAQLANGFGESLLQLQILAARCPVIVVPAMNPEMWRHPAVQENVRKLKNWNYQFVGPVYGKVACGEIGLGHVAEVDEICNIVSHKGDFVPAGFLKGKKVLISAGAMQTPIDVARVIVNKSSGLMGLELARVARFHGADVEVVLGPIRADLEKSYESFRCFRYEGAQKYQTLIEERFSDCDIFVSTAAVLDFETVGKNQKLKRSDLGSQLYFEIQPTQDFVKYCAEVKKPHQRVVAFAAEFGSDREVLSRAKEKLIQKNVDYIVANPIGENTGFGSKTNHMWIVNKNLATVSLGFGSKFDLAVKLFSQIQTDINAESQAIDNFLESSVSQTT